MRVHRASAHYVSILQAVTTAVMSSERFAFEDVDEQMAFIIDNADALYLAVEARDEQDRKAAPPPPPPPDKYGGY